MTSHDFSYGLQHVVANRFWVDSSQGPVVGKAPNVFVQRPLLAVCMVWQANGCLHRSQSVPNSIQALVCECVCEYL